MTQPNSKTEKYSSIEHKAAIDAWLRRWGEKPCHILEALNYAVFQPDLDPMDAAEEIMLARH